MVAKLFIPIGLSLAYVGSLKLTEKAAEGIRHPKTVAAQHSWFCTNSATVLVGLPRCVRRVFLMWGRGGGCCCPGFHWVRSV